MMKLDTMSDIILACDPHRTETPVDRLICRWTYDAGTVKFIRVSANCVFMFQAGGKDFFLRFNHATERSVIALQAEVNFVNYLADSGISVAVPVPSLTGNLVESAHTECGELNAVVFEALPGKRYDDISELSPETFSRWGKSLGDLHLAAQEYHALDDRPTWRNHLGLIASFLPENDAAGRAELKYLQRELSELPVNQGNCGLIHYDFELDNIIWDNCQPGIIDFDDCSCYWFVADIAYALRDLFDDRADAVDLGNDSVRAFFQGYQAARQIDSSEFDLIPLFLRMHNLTTYVKLLRTLQAGKRPPEPVWMDALRDKLTAALHRYHANIVRYQLAGQD